MTQTWEEVKYGMMELNIRGFKGRIWAAFRILTSGRIPTGATWLQLDEQIQLRKKQSAKKAPVIPYKDLNA